VGILFDYFSAPDRASATALQEHPDGLYRAAAARGAEVLALKGLTPHAHVRKLVGLLSGPSYEEMFFSGIPIDLVPLPDLINSEESDVMVCELSNVMRDALADATESGLDDAGRFWATTEEFLLDGWDDELARSWAGELAALARRARDGEETIYCAITL
jgi:hypothetical protein